MEKDSGVILKSLKVDGGAAANNFLMQFQSDILGVNVERPEVIESTAQGSGYLAGIQIGLWSKDDIRQKRKIDKVFKPAFSEIQRDEVYDGWKKAVERTMGWLKT